MLQSSSNQFFFIIILLRIIQSLMGLLNTPVLGTFILQRDQDLTRFG